MKNTEFTDRSKSRKALDFIGVFGRYEDADGRLSNILPNNEMLKSALARQNSGRDIVDILVLAETLFRKDGEFRQRPLAFVSVGFGPISLGKDDPPWSKTIFIEADHPRWGPGNGDESGEFKDKDGDENTDIESGGGQTDSAINGTLIMSDLERKMKLRAARALLKARLVAALRGFSGIAADAVPIAGEVYDAYVLARIVADFVELHADADAAITFAQGGPRALDALRLSLEDEGFSSFDALGKDDEADEVEKRFGRPPTGYDYHHIVEQGGENARQFAPNVINSTENIVKIPKYLHEEISAVYSSGCEEAPGMTLRQWLRGQPYEVQYARGIKVMRDLGIIR